MWTGLSKIGQSIYRSSVAVSLGDVNRFCGILPIFVGYMQSYLVHLELLHKEISLFPRRIFYIGLNT